MFLATVVLLAVACVGVDGEPRDSIETPTSESRSGIEGVVTLGPTCPPSGLQSPCPDRPFEATIDILDAGGTQIIATAVSDADGRFRVPLAPGTYVIRPRQSSGRLPASVQPERVTVGTDQYSTVEIEYDSGIR